MIDDLFNINDHSINLESVKPGKYKKYRIPRKQKKKIPKGQYCYVFTGEVNMVLNKEHNIMVPSYRIKKCPYYKHVEDVDGYCTLIKCDVDDMCKSCGIKF